ncbi:hypothetical protein FQA47_017947 [Oryzias melastigma]|uniref:Uncharacterized protein n=1 Tax=Oryzias melastigma TaxID=30732 RepID=A0A834CPG8_ORYME|nr:hypothetical protein FQA47_017947 [Oryzias melastigma]
MNLGGELVFRILLHQRVQEAGIHTVTTGGRCEVNEARTKRDATKGGLWDVICREADPHWKQREKTVTHVVGERGGDTGAISENPLDSRSAAPTLLKRLKKAPN